MADDSNKQIAKEIRSIATNGTDGLINSALTEIGRAEVQRLMLHVVADLVDIYDEGGVDLAKWPHAALLCTKLAGGGLYKPSGKPPEPPKPQLAVIQNVNAAETRKLKQGAIKR